MALMVRCILYPDAHLFVTSGGKEQGASILSSKVAEICKLIPALGREIDWRRGKTLVGKDSVKYVFKNGSTLDNLAARESTRGQRRHGGSMEECVGIDDGILREVIIPVMAVSRRAKDGTVNEKEPLNKSQIYITTAGYKGTYPYDRLIGMLVRMVTQPERCMVLGGTWRTPVAMGLQSKTFIKDQKEEGTYNEASFEREYESIWSGSTEDAFFNAEIFNRNRVLNLPEHEASGRASRLAYYILAVDVGRKGCDTVICVFKVTPQAQGTSIKNLVNIITLTDEHFEDQAIKLKKLFFKYNASRIVIDGNGMGIGLVDYMVKSQIDPETLEVYPDFGVYEDTEQYYKKYKTPNTVLDAMYIIKATAPINSEAHANARSQLSSGKVKFLIDERVAKNKLIATKVGQNMTPEERSIYLKPFTLTSILRDEMMNLREENEGINIILKQANRGIRKDKFSAFEYGLFYIKQEEDKKKKRERFNPKDWCFLNLEEKKEMMSSRGEIKIHEILSDAGFNFKEEYIFPDLKSPNGRPLRFDFVIFDDDGKIDFIIEYQGKQHYEASSKFGGKKGLYQQQYNDNQKRRFCALHDFNLIEIPYTEENLINYDYIMKLAGY